jgi:hypothetical protein
MASLGFGASNSLDLIDPEAIRYASDVREEIQSSGSHKLKFSEAIIAAATTHSYQISSVSPTLIDNDDIVTVSYQSSHPQPWDWIGAYSPPDVNITITAPIKFGNCSGNTTINYLKTGFGALNFNLTNMRAGVKFYYFTGGTKIPLLVANSSQVVEFRNPNQPLRQRIVPTGNPNIYTLLWSSKNSTIPMVKWGTSPGNYPYVVNATTYTFTKDDMCGGVAKTTGWRDPGLIHAVNLTGILDLNLDSKPINYIFGDEATNDFSQEIYFLVPPRAGRQPPNRPTTVAVFGDLGVGSTDSSYDTEVWDEACPPAINTTMSVSALVAKGLVDAVYHTGDISYANGYMSSWDFYLDMISPMAGSSLYLTTVGNHESDWPNTASLDFAWNFASGGECGVPELKFIPMPAPASTNKPWWSYEIGIIHFVGMSTEHNYTIGSEQYKFIENDLKSVNRTKTPWVIFSGHRPFYVDSDYCCRNYDDDNCSVCLLGTDVSDMQNLQANIEPLLHKYQVNLGFAGHFHDMERQSAVYQNQVVQAAQMVTIDGQEVAYHPNPNGTVWMVVGSAGNGPSIATTFYPWSEKYWDRTWGYAMIYAVNSTYLKWELINSATDEVIDRMVLTQNFEPWDPIPAPPSPSSSNSNSGLFGLNQAGGITLLVFIILIGLGFSALLVKFLVLPKMASQSGERKRLISKNQELTAGKDQV